WASTTSRATSNTSSSQPDARLTRTPGALLDARCMEPLEPGTELAALRCGRRLVRISHRRPLAGGRLLRTLANGSSGLCAGQALIGRELDLLAGGHGLIDTIRDTRRALETERSTA